MLPTMNLYRDSFESRRVTNSFAVCHEQKKARGSERLMRCPDHCVRNMFPLCRHQRPSATHQNAGATLSPHHRVDVVRGNRVRSSESTAGPQHLVTESVFKRADRKYVLASAPSCSLEIGLLKKKATLRISTSHAVCCYTHKYAPI